MKKNLIFLLGLFLMGLSSCSSEEDLSFSDRAQNTNSIRSTEFESDDYDDYEVQFTGLSSGYVFMGENKEPALGVNVMLKGTLVTASTDINGYFSLKIPSSLQGKPFTLEISYITFRTMSVERTSFIEHALVGDEGIRDVVVRDKIDENGAHYREVQAYMNEEYQFKGWTTNSINGYFSANPYRLPQNTTNVYYANSIVNQSTGNGGNGGSSGPGDSENGGDNNDGGSISETYYYIRGYSIDSNDEPLPFIRVVISKGPYESYVYGAYADIRGVFSLSFFGSGEMDIIFSKLGFETKKMALKDFHNSDYITLKEY